MAAKVLTNLAKVLTNSANVLTNSANVLTNSANVLTHGGTRREKGRGVGSLPPPLRCRWEHSRNPRLIILYDTLGMALLYNIIHLLTFQMPTPWGRHL